MTVYFDDIQLQAKFDGANWTDFTSDTVGEINAWYGIDGNGALDRVASPGELTFSLDNSIANSAHKLGYYSPGHVNCRVGFKPGLEIRVLFTLDLIPVEKWIGRIPSDGINVVPGMYKERRTSVTVKTWMHQAALHPLKGFQLSTNKTIMQGIALILASMDIQPPGTVDYRTGESVFSYIGDTVTSRTTALAEFGKMTQSELGYLYETRHGLRVEGRLTRNEEKTALDEYPQSRSELSVFAIDENDNLVDDDGDEILCSDSTSAFFDNAQVGMTASFGKNFYNSAKFTAYPRRVDAAATTVLFNLQSPMAIGAGETAIISGSYKDPTGVAQSVSGISMVTPVAGTHYACYQNKDGTGTNLTANLTVTAVFGTGDFKYTIVNSGAAGYITMAKAVGKGIYTDIPAEYYLEDAASIAEHGDYPLVVEMKYQDDPMVAARWAQVSLFQYKNLISSVDSVDFIASSSGPMMNAFLYLEPGDRVRIKEDVTAIFGDFFIHAVKFSIKPGNIVTFSWTLRAAGLDTFNFVKWTSDATPVAGYGTWSDPVYGWDF
jgi:hypothetical protein